MSINFENSHLNPLYNNLFIVDREIEINSSNSSDSNDVESVNSDAECRICLESHGNLIVICDCKGSCKYVHKECIETWINSFDYDDIRYNKCEICKSNYNLELLDLDEPEEDECNCNVLNTSCKVIIALDKKSKKLVGLKNSIILSTKYQEKKWPKLSKHCQINLRR